MKVTSGSEGLLIAGHGVALANCAVEQDCAYWEVKVLLGGHLKDLWELSE